MNCPRCGAWADVLETRKAPDNATRRRYECANEHRFTTIELLKPGSISTRTVRDRANKSQED
jgi:transcriptional regulator NrdR family protein